MNIEPIKVIIAEDEPIIRNYLIGLLLKIEGIEVIGEATNGKKLIAITLELEPDAIFVDIGMPDIDGLTAVEKITELLPDIYTVFITGYANFALKAFEVSARDYIVKPVEIGRLEKSVARIKDYLQRIKSKKIINQSRVNETLVIKSGYEHHFIDINTVIFFEKENKKTIIHTHKRNYETYESMEKITKRLDSEIFFRSHKSFIINIKKIDKIEPWGDKSYLIKFNGTSDDVLISKNKIKTLFSLI